MKLPRILVLAGLAASIATAAASPASAQTVFYGRPLGYGYQYTYYTDEMRTTLVSINYKGCDGIETWDGYNGYPDLTLGQAYDYIEWNC